MRFVWQTRTKAALLRRAPLPRRQLRDGCILLSRRDGRLPTGDTISPLRTRFRRAFSTTTAAAYQDATSLLSQARGLIDTDTAGLLSQLESTHDYDLEALETGQRYLTDYIRALDTMERSEQRAQIKADKAAERFLAWTQTRGVRTAIENNSSGCKQYIDDLAYVVVGGCKTSLLKEWFVYQNRRKDQRPVPGRAHRLEYEKKLREWSDRNQWKATLLAALFNALLEWSSGRSADAAIELAIWANDISSRPGPGIYDIPVVPPLIGLDNRMRAGESPGTSAAMYEEFVNLRVRDHTAPKEKLVQRIRLMLRHPHGPDLDLALIAFGEVAADPEHQLRSKHGSGYAELRSLGRGHVQRLIDAGRLQDANWLSAAVEDIWPYRADLPGSHKRSRK